MPIIEIEIKNKIARSPEAEIVCGNSDYEIHFSFDEEWSEYNVKTARFRYNGTKEDVVFEGNVCNAPIIKGASFCTVGVFAGNLHTTTPAVIVCKRGALCDDGMPADPTPDVYAQIMELLNNITGMDDEVVARALADYLAKNPLQENDPTVPAWAKQPEKPKYTAQEVGALPSTTAIPTKPEDVNAAPKQMEVKIVNGWASHTPAQIFAHVQAGGDAITYGLTGMVHRIDTIRETLAVFNCNNINTTGVNKYYVVIAENGKVTTGQNDYNPSVPTTLPNPNALTFTGAVEGSYDGSKALSVEIPSAPTALPNPKTLTFTGAVEGTYDGSQALTIEIPQGGGESGGGESKEWVHIAQIEITEPVTNIHITEDIDGKPFEVENLYFLLKIVKRTELGGIKIFKRLFHEKGDFNEKESMTRGHLFQQNSVGNKSMDKYYYFESSVVANYRKQVSVESNFDIFSYAAVVAPAAYHDGVNLHKPIAAATVDGIWINAPTVSFQVGDTIDIWGI